MTTPAEPLCVRCQKRRALEMRNMCAPCLRAEYTQGEPLEPLMGPYDTRTLLDAILDTWGLPRNTAVTYRNGYGDEFEEEWAGCLTKFILMPWQKRWQDRRALTTFRDSDGVRYLVLAYRVWFPGEPTYRVRYPEDSPTALHLIRTFAPTVKQPGPETGRHLPADYRRYCDEYRAWLKAYGKRPSMADLAEMLNVSRATLTRRRRHWQEDMGLPVDDL